MKRILSLIIFLTFINCFEKNKTESAERDAFIYTSENPKEEIFDFKIDKKTDFATYKYVSQKDSSKTIFLEFTRKKKIFWAGDEFKVSKKDPVKFKSLSEKEFYFYNLKEPIVDGTGPLLFNKDYGLLGIYNSFGPIIIFLKDSDKELNKQVYKALLE
ncbi:hypothetical protein [uncultured Christiangramia sp.]|uniref:hypothetical protein n=1 Tax=uncultured Christiangramia sp. TaxID=503836 RepID=UPI0026055F1F|nr:hypothetical protein [uncultured Christiangramia sp.]